MKTVRPKPLGDQASGALTPEEGFVLSRIDGRLSVGDLVVLTGIEEPRVEQIVAHLASMGRVTLGELAAASEEEPTTSFADFAAALGMDPSPFADSGAASGAVEQEVELTPARSAGPTSRHEPLTEAPGFVATLGSHDADEPAAGEPPAHEAQPSDEPHEDANAGAYAANEQRSDETQEDANAGAYAANEQPSDEPQEDEPNEDATADADADTDADADADTDADADAEESEEARAANEQDYRKIYQSQFSGLTPDVRVALAPTVVGTDLLALCLDGDPRVVAAILDNPTVGLQHVRLVAFHHRTGTGLERLTRRSDFLRDMLVERRLLRNPQAGDTVLARIFASKRVFQSYKIAIDRDVPELTRARGRGYLRQKFQAAPPEERADLVIRTEARCLVLMTGCTFDAKTTSILSSRPYNSTLFIQNLAKFSATPPGLLAHLMKQPFVRKSVALKRMLIQHPNMPGDVKRQT